MRKHTVKQGEDMLTIAVKYGLADWEAVYNHQANERLKKLRPDPMRLLPGDIVYIPDSQPISYKLATNQSHTIQVAIPKATFSVQLRDAYNEPLAGIPYRLILGSGTNQETFEGKTDGEGKVEHKLRAQCQRQQGYLLYWPDPDDDESFAIAEVGYRELDPFDEAPGALGRLNNACFECRPTDDIAGYVMGLSAFKKQAELDANTPDADTNKKLDQI